MVSVHVLLHQNLLKTIICQMSFAIKTSDLWLDTSDSLVKKQLLRLEDTRGRLLFGLDFKVDDVEVGDGKGSDFQCEY